MPPPRTDASNGRPNRWQAAAWSFWRPSATPDPAIASGGQLGGSQAGLRVEYDLTPGARSRLSAYARITSALQNPASPEAATGVALQLSRSIPVSLAVERRISLGTGGRDAFAAMAVGGFGPTAVGSGIQAEAYAQTGMVGLQRRDLFFDGKLSLFSPVNDTPIRLGAAVSGGAQPGASRLDLGPELQVRLPLPRAAARLAVEWRERIAGDARPGSGLAITLAGDF